MAWETDLSALSEEAIGGLGRRDEWGQHLNFEETIPKLRLAREIGVGVNASIRLASQKVQENVGIALSAVAGTREQIERFDATTGDAAAVRGSLISQLDRALDDLKQWGAPIAFAPQQAAWSDLSQAAREDLAAIRDARATADRLAEALQAKGTVASATISSGHYEIQADRHRFKSWLGAAGAVGSLTILLGLASGLWPDQLGRVTPADLTSPNPVLAVLVAAGPRLFLAALAAYALRFALRYFSVNSHLQVVNEAKRNALNTYPLLIASASKPEAADALLSEIVRALFLDPHTGYINAESSASLSLPGGFNVSAGKD
jgi:hypothetical protein